MIPTHTTNGIIHWRKWPGRVACGGVATGPVQHQAPGSITCEACMQLVASWHQGTRFTLVSTTGLALAAAGIDETTFSSWDRAHLALKQARRLAFHLKKQHGQIPRFRLTLDTNLVLDQAALTRCVAIPIVAEAGR